MRNAKAKLLNLKFGHYYFMLLGSNKLIACLFQIGFNIYWLSLRQFTNEIVSIWYIIKY